MDDIVLKLFETTGFPKRKECGSAWTPQLISLHVCSDLFIWLAYISIPLILLYFTRRRDLPFPRLFILFALFILACGTTHLIEAMMFEFPIYRLAGMMKLATAVVSWITVIALIPIVPRVMHAVNEAAAQGADTRLHAPLPTNTSQSWFPYLVAVLAAGVAVFVRALIDPLTEDGDYIFVVALLSVVYMSWQYGFGPGLACLGVCLISYVYLFVTPRGQFSIDGLGNQLAVSLFFFCGFACCILGESQRTAHRRAQRALETAIQRHQELEEEIVRRQRVEKTLRQREHDLLRSEERFRNLTEAIPQIVWTADETGVIQFVNRRWDDFTGLPRQTQQNHGWNHTAVHKEDAERLQSKWNRVLTHEINEFSEECRLRNQADGEYHWMLAVATPMGSASGNESEWVGTLTDIDDQKRHAATLAQMVGERTSELQAAVEALQTEIEERKVVEEQLRTMAKELERSNGELETFAYVASHDLQEPLRKIQAFGDRLRDRCREQLPESGKEYIDRMLAAAGRMRRLIDDLLSFSRVATQQRPFQPLDLGKLIREVVSDLDTRIAQSGGSVTIGAMPEIAADPTQMRQLFQNLIANAVKFQKPGLPPIVQIMSEVDSPLPTDTRVRMCRVMVRDNGIGFDEKYCDRIFEVFQRLHGRDEYEGTGVGLAICRKIVERHGGTITATSRIGEGTTFTVSIPMSQSTTHEGITPNGE